MSMNRSAPLVVLGAALAMVACAEQSGSVPEVPADELTAEVAELDAIHDVMAPMWHEAWPAGDHAAIQEAAMEFQTLVEALNQVTLPGILQDKQAAWDEQKALLNESYGGLKAAAEAGENERMMAFAEAFHMNYEGLVRIIRPALPELDAFHQHLYGLYHYYGPGYDLEKIGSAARGMAAAVPPLQAAILPERLSSHQDHFEMAVQSLGKKVGALITTLENPSRAEVVEAIEAVHGAYEEVEGVFDPGSSNEGSHD